MLGFTSLSARSISGLPITVIPPTPTVTDTHDYPFPVVDYHRKRVHRQDRLRREEEAKQRAVNNIRQQIEDVLHPKAAEEVETTAEPVVAEQKTPQRASNLLALLEKLENEIMFIQEQQRIEAAMMRRARDEEDMAAILYLL